MDVVCDLWIIKMHKKKDIVIMKVGIGKGEEILDIVWWMLVPLYDGNIGDD